MNHEDRHGHDAGSPGGSPGNPWPAGVHPDAPVGVFQSPRKKPCSERALVLHAVGLPHRVVQIDGLFHLTVPARAAQRAIDELSEYTEENANWPPRHPPPPSLSNGKLGALVYGLTILAFYPLGRRGGFGLDFWHTGRMDAGAVLDGEWWRPVTALFLHADWGHLAGNMVFGAAFAVLAAHLLGSGLTWFAIVLAGGLGNWANAFIQPETHLAIGASTAVFGALGVLSAYEWVRREHLHLPPMRRFAPLLGGAVLLGFLGTSGERTDVMAHVLGLGMGAVVGATIGKLRLPERLDGRAQAVLGALAVVVSAIAWVGALA